MIGLNLQKKKRNWFIQVCRLRKKELKNTQIERSISTYIEFLESQFSNQYLVSCSNGVYFFVKRTSVLLFGILNVIKTIDCILIS